MPAEPLICCVRAAQTSGLYRYCLRKQTLAPIVPPHFDRLLCVDHTRRTGTQLYRLACQFDLEGIVGKRIDSLYDDEHDIGTTSWLKIANPGYSRAPRNNRILGSA